MRHKVDPLVKQGSKVHISFSNDRAFGTSLVTIPAGRYGERSYSYTRSKSPTPELLKWMETQCGPRGILWTTVKGSEGIDVYFAVPGQAMMFKLAWGGV